MHERGAPRRGRRARAVLNFPTKDDWREPSRLGSVVDGLAFLRERYRGWGIDSLAVPALGCGRGGLRWEQVRPILIEGLRPLEVPVFIFSPLG